VSAKRLTIAGAVLAAAGLLVLPPAVAYAHTEDVFGITGTPNPSPSLELEFYTDLELAAISRTDGGITELAPLLEEAPSFGYYGIEILDEQAYLLYNLGIFGEIFEVDELPALLVPWDHATGEQDWDAAVPLLLPLGIADPGGLLEDYADPRVLGAIDLDVTPDGRLLTILQLVALDGEENEVVFLFVAEIDPATGGLTILESIDAGPAGGLIGFLAGLALATDPTTETTWLFLTDGEVSYAGPVDLEPASIELFPVELPGIASDELEAAAGFGGLEAAALDLADLAELTGPIELYGPGYLIGADFDEDGGLWYYYLPSSSEGPQDFSAVQLGSIPGPFGVDAPAEDGGLAAAADQFVFVGNFGPQPNFAVEGGAIAVLPSTGVEILAPIGAVAVALLGGVLLLLGRRARATA